MVIKMGLAFALVVTQHLAHHQKNLLKYLKM